MSSLVSASPRVLFCVLPRRHFTPQPCLGQSAPTRHHPHLGHTNAKPGNESPITNPHPQSRPAGFFRFYLTAIGRRWWPTRSRCFNPVQRGFFVSTTINDLLLTTMHGPVSIPSSGIFSFLRQTAYVEFNIGFSMFQSRPAGFFCFYDNRAQCTDAPCPVCLTPKTACRNCNCSATRK